MLFPIFILSYFMLLSQLNGTLSFSIFRFVSTFLCHFTVHISFKPHFIWEREECIEHSVLYNNINYGIISCISTINHSSYSFILTAIIYCTAPHLSAYFPVKHSCYFTSRIAHVQTCCEHINHQGLRSSAQIRSYF